MNCSQTAKTDPWLDIVSEIVSVRGACTVGSDGKDLHRITGENRSLLRYKVDLKGHCISPCVCYIDPDPAKGLQPTWNDSFDLPARPGKGGAMERGAERALKSCGAAKYQTINVDVRWADESFPYTYSEQLSAQVTTR